MKINEILKNKKTLSFEVYPPRKDSNDIDKIYEAIRGLALFKPDFISVTFGAGGSNSRNTINIASFIKNELNIEALAHVTCGPLNTNDIDKVVSELKENKIENILALRGDKPLDLDIPYCETYKHATDLMEYLDKEDFCIAGACYPEGHPECRSLYDDLINLKKKQDLGAEFFITQMFFDNDYYYRLLREARKIGITIPIIPAIMPLTNIKSIEKSINMTGCSIPISLRAMIERFQDDKKAIREIGINYAVYQILDLLANDVDGIHLYVMNSPKTASDVISKIENVLAKEMN